MKNILVVKIVLLAVLLGSVGLGLSVENAEAHELECSWEFDFSDVLYPYKKVWECVPHPHFPAPQGGDSHIPSQPPCEPYPDPVKTYYKFRLVNNGDKTVKYFIRSGTNWNPYSLEPGNGNAYTRLASFTTGCGPITTYDKPLFGYYQFQSRDGSGDSWWSTYMGMKDNRLMGFEKFEDAAFFWVLKDYDYGNTWGRIPN